MAKEVERREIGKVDFNYDGTEIKDVTIAEFTVTNEWKGEKTVSKYFTTQPLPDVDLPADKIRLYPFLGGKKGHRLTDEEALALFRGESVHAEGLPKTKGGTYDADFIFNPVEVPSFLSKPYYQGVTEFAPRD